MGLSIYVSVSGNNKVYLDKVGGGIGTTPLFEDGFEDGDILPFPKNWLDRASWVERRWHQERPSSTAKIVTEPVLEGSYACMLDSTPKLHIPRWEDIDAIVYPVALGTELEEWFANPGRAYHEAYYRFEPDLPNDVVFGVDAELG